MKKNPMMTLTHTILGIPVLVDVSLDVDGTSVTLNPQDVRRLLNSIHWTNQPPVNGRVSVTVVAETIPYLGVSKEDSNKPVTTDPTRT